MRVVIAGDWHGNTHRGINLIKWTAEKGMDRIYQLGDFGLWPGQGGAKYLLKLQHHAKENGITIFWLDGNHENHDALDLHRQAADGHWPIPTVGNDRILYMPRGHRFELDGHKWAVCGGAISIDKDNRILGKSYWAQESITDEDVDFAISGGKADVLLTHDCPADVIHDWLMVPNGRYKVLNESHKNRLQLQRVVDTVQPSWIFHGHLHYDYHKMVNMNHGPVHVVGLNMEYDRNNNLVFDTEKLEVVESS